MHKSDLTILFSVILLLFSSCEKKESFDSIEILGHAGNGLSSANSLYHDNTLESIQLALLTDGCDGVEVDVRMSADHTLWLYHDTELESETNGTGCVSLSSDSYLSSLHYTTIDKESLIRLTDIPKDYLVNKKVYIDARPSESCTNSIIDLNAFVNQLIAFRSACLPTTEIIVESNDVNWESALSANGFTTIKFITDFSQYASVDDNFATVDVIVSTNATLTKDNIALIHADGREVILFGIRSVKSTREAYSKHPNGILADNLRTAIIEKR